MLGLHYRKWWTNAGRRATAGAIGSSARVDKPRRCHEMLESLAAGNGYIAGFNSLARAAGGALDKPLAFIDGHGARTTEAQALCRKGETAALLELLGGFERAVGEDFDRHLATCRERGWRPVEERLAGAPAAR